jgi:hypothetical protein
MPATSNNSGNMARRQSFNGRALTFVEVIFGLDVTASATTPEAKDSTFDKVSKVVNKNGNLIAQSYRLGAKATDNDAAEAETIEADESIDSYQFIVEGTPGQYNAADSAGDVNMDIDATVLAAAEADLETDILDAIDVGDSTRIVQVKMRTLLPEGHANGDANSFIGMFDQRGDA